MLDLHWQYALKSELTMMISIDFEHQNYTKLNHVSNSDERKSCLALILYWVWFWFSHAVSSFRLVWIYFVSYHLTLQWWRSILRSFLWKWNPFKDSMLGMSICTFHKAEFSTYVLKNPYFLSQIFYQADRPLKELHSEFLRSILAQSV